MTQDTHETPIETSGTHAGTAGTKAVAAPFKEEEIQSFRASDASAGTAIIILMTAVFTIGLLLYSYIAITT